nr:hypothetical protein CFP56_10617 [Quercus suber]
MREEENDKEEGVMEDDLDEYGSEIGSKSAASVRSVALVRSRVGEKMEQTLLQLRILKVTMTIGWASDRTNGLYFSSQ